MLSRLNSKRKKLYLLRNGKQNAKLLLCKHESKNKPKPKLYF